MHVHELFMSHPLWNHCDTRWLRVILGRYIGECTYQQLISVMVLKNLPLGIKIVISVKYCYLNVR